MALTLIIGIAEPKRRNVKILSYNQGVIRNDGGYKFAYRTENGIQVKEKNTPVDSLNAVTGSYEYLTPDGKKILVNYVADENGFHPVFSGSGARRLPQGASVKVLRG